MQWREGLCGPRKHLAEVAAGGEHALWTTKNAFSFTKHEIGPDPICLPDRHSGPSAAGRSQGVKKSSKDYEGM